MLFGTAQISGNFLLDIVLYQKLWVDSLRQVISGNGLLFFSLAVLASVTIDDWIDRCLSSHRDISFTFIIIVILNLIMMLMIVLIYGASNDNTEQIPDSSNLITFQIFILCYTLIYTFFSKWHEYHIILKN